MRSEQQEEMAGAVVFALAGMSDKRVSIRARRGGSIYEREGRVKKSSHSQYWWQDSLQEDLD